MKLLALTAVLTLAATVASASPLTCWYNAEGTYTGADGGSQGVPEDKWDADHAIPRPAGGSGDYAFVIVLSKWEDGNSCPRTAEVMEE